jgi:hypothetical protein
MSQTSNKEMLRLTGFPRSGNKFVISAVKLLYFPELDHNSTYHSPDGVFSNTEYPNLFVVRNPKDAVSSWVYHARHNMGERNNPNYAPPGSLLFYESFLLAALNNIENVCILSFDSFTNDIEYIKQRINNAFMIENTGEATVQDVKDYMTTNSMELSLPSDADLTGLRIETESDPEYARIYSLYQDIIEAHDIQG